MKKYVEEKELKDFVKEFNVNNIILKKYAYQNKPLNFDLAYSLGLYTLSPYVKELKNIFDQKEDIIQIQSIAALCSLHNKENYLRENAEQQIAGICAAVFDYDIGTSDKNFFNPKVDYVIDNSGMGGDLFRTPNVSIIASLIAASDNIPVCKHGSPGNTDNVGSSDFISYNDINLFADKEKVEFAIENINFGYIEALDTKSKYIHTLTHQFAKLAHMNDIIGPITNPVNPYLMKKRVVGINHLIKPEVVAKAYKVLNEKKITNLEHGLFVRGFIDKSRNGGIDEISNMPGGSIVAELKDNEVITYELYAKDFGLKEADYKDIEPKENKAEFSTKILKGIITGAPLELILANASILEYLAHNLTLKEGVEKSRELLKSGIPYSILKQYKEIVK